VAVALRGNLSDFGIGEVFQLIGQQRKTGLLEVDRAGRRLHVAFAEGSVVWASPAGEHEDAALGQLLVRAGALSPEQLVGLEPRLAEGATLRRLAQQEAGVAADELEALEEMLTRDTVFEVLCWSTGSFHFTAQRVPDRGGAARRWPAEQILMDSLRMVDEWRTFDADARREEAVFRRAAPFESYGDAVRGETPEQLAVAARLYELIDGTRHVRRVLDLARVTSFEGARILTGLRRAGAIEPGVPAAAAAAPAPRSAAARAPARALRAAAAAVPFAALALVAWLAQRPAAPPGARLVPDPLAAARAAAAATRVRNAAEAFHFLHGRWPRDAAELAGSGLGADAMAGAGADPYVTGSAAGGAFAVLAPEP